VIDNKLKKGLDNTSNSQLKIEINDLTTESKQELFHDIIYIDTKSLNLLDIIKFNDDKINKEITDIKNILPNFYNTIKKVFKEKIIHGTNTEKININMVIQFIFSNIIYLLHNIKSILETKEVNNTILNDFDQINKNIESFNKDEMSKFYTNHCMNKKININICNFYEKYLVSLLNLYVDLLKYIQNYVNKKEIFNNNNDEILFRFKTFDIDNIVPSIILKYIRMINIVRDRDS
jgi:hypothetical protein